MNSSMSVISMILTILLVVAAIAIIIVVLVQKSSSGGAGAAFGGDTASFTQKGKNAGKEAKLKKITIVLGIIFGVLALALAAVS